MVTRAEVGGQLIHVLSEENFWPAARSLLYAKRIDVPRVDYEKLASDRAGDSNRDSADLFRCALAGFHCAFDEAHTLAGSFRPRPMDAPAGFAQGGSVDAEHAGGE